jgi:hypothetical protein
MSVRKLLSQLDVGKYPVTEVSKHENLYIIKSEEFTTLANKQLRDVLEKLPSPLQEPMELHIIRKYQYEVSPSHF